jgi:hypothetical protein
MEALVARLDDLDIPYAILGALALNAYGYLRATVDFPQHGKGADKLRETNRVGRSPRRWRSRRPASVL